MHPILASKARLGLYLLAWVPLAGMLTRLLAGSGGMSWYEAAGMAAPLCVIYAFVCLSAWYLCRFVPLHPSGVFRILLANFSAAALASLLWVAIGMGLDARFAPAAQQLFVIGVLLYLLAAAVHYVLLALESSRAAERREMEARILAREAELRALKAQVDPHFLFNSLHSISALTSADPDRAREMCVLLSDFLRASLGLGERTSVPLEEELSLARSYLAVERVRFGPRLRVEEAVDEAARQCRVPPLLLQPLVENAVRHGIANLVEGGWIRVEARCTEGRLELAVENNFDRETPTPRRNGLGLANVRKRLAVRYGSAARMDVRVVEDRHRVELCFPAEQGDE
jgi:two-component system sensor histidine kinase AlgZ